MQGKKRGREQEGDDYCSSDQDTPSLIIARRRKSRRRAVCPLPDYVRQQLTQAFGNVDIQGEGRVNRFKLLEIVKEVYHPTDAEVNNVIEYFKSVPCCSQLEHNGEVSFECFAAMFNCVVLPVLTGLELGWKGLTGLDLGWNAARDLFNQRITQTARHGASTPITAPAGDSTGEMFQEELCLYYESIHLNTQGSFLCEMVRQAFIVPPKQLTQLAAFFNTSADDKVSLSQFIHGMTLIYGDMKLLLTTVEPTSPVRFEISSPPPKNHSELRAGDISSPESPRNRPEFRPIERGETPPGVDFGSERPMASPQADGFERMLYEHENSLARRRRRSCI